MLSKITAYTSAKGPKRWALWLYISLGVLAAGVSFYFWYARKKREIIELRKSAARAHIDAENTRYVLGLATDKAEIAKLAAEANEYQHEASQIRDQIGKEEKLLAQKLKDITELKSWKDIDAYNKQGRS